jgi:hypothetical protein
MVLCEVLAIAEWASDVCEEDREENDPCGRSADINTGKYIDSF